MNDPHIWWYITRASALIAWTLMTFSVVWGVLLSTRVLRKIDNPGWLQDLHAYLGGLTLFMVLLHMVSLMLDGWLQFSVFETFVPFATDYRPIATALGIISFYILLVVQVTSLFINKLPRSFWKAIHYFSYGAVFLVALHAGWSGTDVGTWWYRVLAITLISMAAIAAVVRIIVGKRAKSTSQTPRQTEETQTVAQVKPETLTVIVSQMDMIAENVKLIKFIPLGGGPLPIWQPGAHITLFLPNGLQRQYSLCGDPADRNHYEIAVLASPTSEGGSQWIHSELRLGTKLDILPPRNHFECEPANEYIFIAGGIGITPIKAMIESLPAHRTWKLLYYGRSRKTMAFAQELSRKFPDQVQLITSKQPKPHLNKILSNAQAQIYCCGPEKLLSEVTEYSRPENLHVERFVPVERTPDTPRAPIEVSCRKSKKEITVGENQTVLEALEEVGVPILGSCKKGVCGTCEVRVLEGTPLHLDSVMSDEEKNKLGIMFPCVSRASTPNLVLDI